MFWGSSESFLHGGVTQKPRSLSSLSFDAIRRPKFPLLFSCLLRVSHASAIGMLFALVS
jgi:hypothetical protein